jgi:hypothetical protein
MSTTRIALAVLFVVTSGRLLGTPNARDNGFTCKQADLHIKSCAKGATYRYLECEQKKAYSTSTLEQNILDADRKRGLMNVGNTDPHNRPNELGVQPTVNNAILAGLNRRIAKIKLPTCYEDPYNYAMIAGHVEVIEIARRELGMPLKHQPKYGSLPTEEVNAYTFPASEDHESIIAFNKELSSFAYVLTTSIVPTVPIDQVNGAYKKPTATEIVVTFASHPELTSNLERAILEFLHLPFRSESHLDQAYDRLAIPLNAAMGIFATAHEYGHLIKDHHSVTANLRIAENTDPDGNPVTTPVLIRSWNQELEADQLGTLLLIQVMRDTVRANPELKEQWLYSLRGALLFFTCLQIIDDAKYIKKHGVLPPELSDVQKNLIRATTIRELTSDEKKSLSGIELENHPPAWFRLEKVRDLIRQADKQYAVPSELREARKGDAIVDYADILWAYSRTRISRTIAAAMKH